MRSFYAWGCSLWGKALRARRREISPPSPRQDFFSQSFPVSLKSKGYTPMTAKITTA